jgi:hypothetical protein
MEKRNTNRINRLAKGLTGNVNVDERVVTNTLFDMILNTYGVQSEQFKLIETIDMYTQYNACNQNYNSMVDKEDIKRLIEITK